MLGEHPFGSMLAKICQLHVHATLVQLDCLDKDTTNTVVSDLLHLLTCLTQTLLDVVYHKSHGNQLSECILETFLLFKCLMRL